MVCSLVIFENLIKICSLVFFPQKLQQTNTGAVKVAEGAAPVLFMMSAEEEEGTFGWLGWLITKIFRG